MKKLIAYFNRPRNRQTGRALTNLQEFIREEGGGGILLLVATFLALLWANSPLAESYTSLWETPLTIGIGNWALSKSLFHWINDGLMAIFFFVVGLEIKREILIGELSKPRQALFPIVAALGGMIVPAILYAAFNFDGAGANGWAIPMATDIAFALGILSLLGKRVPFALKVFLTAVAIVDDLGAILVIAIFYSHEIAWASLLFGGFVLVVLFIFNRLSVRSPLPYALLGIVLWLAFLQSGIHATIAGVLLAMTIPANPRIDRKSFLRHIYSHLRVFENPETLEAGPLASDEEHAAVRALEKTAESVVSPLQRLEDTLHPWVAYAIIPIFALANAGVSIGTQETLVAPVGFGIVAGLVLGKQLGITLFSVVFARLGFIAKPRSLRWAHIYGAAWLGGIGFTMSLFITDLAFADADLILSAKIGILVSSALAAAGAAIVLLAFGKKTAPP